MAAERLLHRQRNLADGRLGARRLDGKLQQIGAAARALRQRGERGLVVGFVALGAQALQLLDLQRAHLARVDLEHVELALDVGRKGVDADHRLLAGIDARLRARRRLLDAPLRQALLDRLAPCRRAPRSRRYARCARAARSAVRRST